MTNYPNKSWYLSEKAKSQPLAFAVVFYIVIRRCEEIELRKFRFEQLFLSSGGRNENLALELKQITDNGYHPARMAKAPIKNAD